MAKNPLAHKFNLKIQPVFWILLLGIFAMGVVILQSSLHVWLTAQQEGVEVKDPKTVRVDFAAYEQAKQREEQGHIFRATSTPIFDPFNVQINTK